MAEIIGFTPSGKFPKIEKEKEKEEEEEEESPVPGRKQEALAEENRDYFFIEREVENLYDRLDNIYDETGNEHVRWIEGVVNSRTRNKEYEKLERELGAILDGFKEDSEIPNKLVGVVAVFLERLRRFNKGKYVVKTKEVAGFGRNLAGQESGDLTGEEDEAKKEKRDQ